MSGSLGTTKAGQQVPLVSDIVWPRRCQKKPCPHHTSLVHSAETTLGLSLKRHSRLRTFLFFMAAWLTGCSLVVLGRPATALRFHLPGAADPGAESGWFLWAECVGFHAVRADLSVFVPPVTALRVPFCKCPESQAPGPWNLLPAGWGGFLLGPLSSQHPQKCPQQLLIALRCDQLVRQVLFHLVPALLQGL